jgi:hypothetical protein
MVALCEALSATPLGIGRRKSNKNFDTSDLNASIAADAMSLPLSNYGAAFEQRRIGQWWALVNSRLSNRRSDVFEVDYCAPFCAHPTSKTMADGISRAGKQIACIGAMIQHDSESSRSILIVFGRSLNQRFGGSSPPRFTICFQRVSFI